MPPPIYNELAVGDRVRMDRRGCCVPIGTEGVVTRLDRDEYPETGRATNDPECHVMVDWQETEHLRGATARDWCMKRKELEKIL